jgi:hypothetical protein
MGKVSGEVRGVLTGAAADLQDVPAVRESANKDLEDGALVTLAGFGDGVAHERECVTVSRSATLNTALRIAMLKCHWL